jgi:hypothetical protein
MNQELIDLVAKELWREMERPGGGWRPEQMAHIAIIVVRNYDDAHPRKPPPFPPYVELGIRAEYV